MHFYFFYPSFNKHYSSAVRARARASDDIFRALFVYLLHGLFLHSRQDDHLTPAVPSNFSKKKWSFPIVLKENPQRAPITLRLSHELILESVIAIWQIWCSGCPTWFIPRHAPIPEGWGHPHWTIWAMSQGKRMTWQEEMLQRKSSKCLLRVPPVYLTTHQRVKCTKPNKTWSFLSLPLLPYANCS